MIGEYTVPVFKFAHIDWRAMDYDASWIAGSKEGQVVEAVPFDLSNHPQDLREAELIAIGDVRYEYAFQHKEMTLRWSWANEESEIRVWVEGVRARGRKRYQKELVLPCLPARTHEEAVLYIYPWLKREKDTIEYDLCPLTSIKTGRYVRYEPHLLVAAVLNWEALNLKRTARVQEDGDWYNLRLLEQLTEHGKWYGWYRHGKGGRLEDIGLWYAGRNILDAWNRLLARYAGHTIE